MPPLLAALPFLGKAVAGAKGLIGLGAAKGAASQLVIPGLTAAAKGTGARMAGQGLANAAFKGGLGKAIFGEMSKVRLHHD
jgi:hypothetical protein